MFKKITEKIDTDGYDGWFFNEKFRYLVLDGYKYWYIDNILNRERFNSAEDKNCNEGEI
jgi:hypothetical protein